ncbi:MAG: hypothetical protein ACHQ1G_05600 [Planctomycetota bacterium]
MKAIALVLLLVLPAAADDALAVLAELFDTENAAVRQELRTNLVARGTASITLLDRVRALAKTERGKGLATSILLDLRPALRAAAVKGRVPEGLAETTLLELGLGRAADGKLIVWFDARTFARIEMGMERLMTLEYLVCPVVPGGGKSYECLAGMADAEWEAFGAAYQPGSKLLLKWRGPDGKDVEVALEDTLSWAKPGALDAGGLKVGGNHDERENLRIPPHDTAIQIGLFLDAKK